MALRPFTRARSVHAIIRALALLSAIACLSTCVLWGRSYWRRTYFVAQTLGSSKSLDIYRGRLELILTANPVSTDEVGFIWDDTANLPDVEHRGLFGMFAESGVSPGGHRYLCLILPLWAPAALLCALPAAYVVATLRRLGCNQGCCTFCGYDLRASPARCPECGRACKRKL